VSAPAGWSDGVPLGLQLIGRPFEEGPLLGLAERVAGGGPGRRPPLA
jgi:Asp-tRNA(Asn)/Glu-tRNA(Gln) amidotransferase A subunit family amidase